MINKNAYWVGNLNSEQINVRAQSAKRVIMVLDKTHDAPCGLRRLFMTIGGIRYYSEMKFIIACLI